MVIDTMQLLFSPEQEQILKGGTRMLLAVEPPEVMLRMMPTMEGKARVLAAEKLLEKAKMMTVLEGRHRPPLRAWPVPRADAIRPGRRKGALGPLAELFRRSLAG
jgi:hypothetical protein